MLVSGVGCGGAEMFATGYGKLVASTGAGVRRLRLHGTARSGEATTGEGDDVGFGDPAKVLDVAYVREFVAGLAKEGMVLVSTPDFLLNHESWILASAVSGVVLLGEAGRTREQGLREARTVIADVGAVLLGSIYLERSLP